MMLTACTSLQTISFDQLQAGDVSFPDAVRRVAVVNNMPAFTPGEDWGGMTAELEGDGKVAAEALAKNIADVNYFDEVVICDSTLRAKDDTLRTDRLLTADEVQRLADELGVDMIFSFDRVAIKAKAGTAFHPDHGTLVAVVDGALTPVVRTYVPGRERPLFVVTKSDTIMWEITSELTDEVIMRDAAEYAATIPMKYLLPHWEEANRFYYDGGGVEMRDAGVFLREGNWDEAYALWTTAYDQKKGKVKMQAAFNIALYHEMRDDVEQAKEWLGKARQLVKPGSSDESLLAFYETQLNDRAGKTARLHIQMKRFRENF